MAAVLPLVRNASPEGGDPSQPSSAYGAMQADLDLIAAVLAGADAIRAGRSAYLPIYADETLIEYERRLASAPWRPEFVDALRGVTSKPFAKDGALQGKVSPAIKSFAEDVDKLGNNLHVFGAEVFFQGVASGYHGILIDFPSMRPGLTLEEERQIGGRPYWKHVSARDLIALYRHPATGQIIHARIKERHIELNGFTEKVIDRVRVFEPGRWETWEGVEGGKMRMVASGVLSLDKIPLVIFYAGRRSGPQDAIVQPPFRDLADLQIELYRALSRQEEILTFAGSPMLCASGMAEPEPYRDQLGNLVYRPVTVGPKKVLWATPGGMGGSMPEWKFIQPDAANIAQVALHVKSIIDDMRRLGMQPFTQSGGVPTATGTAIETAKAHSTVQAWAKALKDALEQALVFTSEWLGEASTAEISINADFGLQLDSGSDMAELLKARVGGEISRETYWDELLRRNKLGAQFDPKIEEQRLADEGAQAAAAAPPVDMTAFDAVAAAAVGT